ncbi:MAG: cell wall hydrolase [Smithella sp.]|jgi:hypothetical protein
MFIINLLHLSDILAIAMTLAGEGIGEPWSGKLLIADAIYNYAEDHQLTIRQSCLLRKPNRFSCWDNPSKLIFKTAGYVRDKKSAKAWAECVEIAAMLDGGSYRPTSKAQFYINPKLVKKMPKHLLDMEVVARNGNHVFYAERKP